MLSSPSTRRHRPSAAAPTLLWVLLLAAPGAPLLAQGVAIESELDLGEWTPSSPPLESESAVCVYHAGGGVIYRVIASGTQSGGAFELVAAHSQALDYRVFWYPSGRGGGSEELTAGVPSQQTVLANPVPQCSGDGGQALIRVSVADADIEQVLPGTYRGELLLTLSPL